MLVELCCVDLAEQELPPAMTRVAELARLGVAGTAGASVSLGRPQAPTLVAACSPLAQRADGVQLQAGEGPSLDAYVIRDVVVADDAWADGRWPRLGAWPVGEPRVRGVVAVPLLRNRSALGVLTLYGAAAAAGWTRRSRAAVAPYAGRALSLALVERKLVQLATQRDQYAEALTSRATIDQAKGVVMLLRGCDADTAFEILKSMSNRGNRKLRDVADDVVRNAREGRTTFAEPRDRRPSRRSRG